MTQGEIEQLTVKTENIFSELEVRIMSEWRIHSIGRLADQQTAEAGNVREADPHMDSESPGSVR